MTRGKFFPSRNRRVDAGKFAKGWLSGESHHIPWVGTSLLSPLDLALQGRGQMQTQAPFLNPERNRLATTVFLFRIVSINTK